MYTIAISIDSAETAFAFYCVFDISHCFCSNLKLNEVLKREIRTKKKETFLSPSVTE